MAYCTIDEIKSEISEEKLIRLTDDANSGTVNVTVANQEIANAGGEIDAYCQGRYGASLPFSTVPALIRMLALDIVIYRLYKRRGNIPEDWQKAYDQAVKKLDGISRGIIDLGTTAVSEDGVTFTNKTPEDRKFRAPEGFLD